MLAIPAMQPGDLLHKSTSAETLPSCCKDWGDTTLLSLLATLTSQDQVSLTHPGFQWQLPSAAHVTTASSVPPLFCMALLLSLHIFHKDPLNIPFFLLSLWFRASMRTPMAGEAQPNPWPRGPGSSILSGAPSVQTSLCFGHQPQ